MKISLSKILFIIEDQKDRWMNEDLNLIYSDKELREKIEDDFLSENDITDKHENFENEVSYDFVCDLRRDKMKEVLIFHNIYIPGETL